jgi:site-specific DNA-adenine methylase
MYDTVEIRFENLFQEHESKEIDDSTKRAVDRFCKVYNPTEGKAQMYYCMVGGHFSYNMFHRYLVQDTAKAFVELYKCVSGYDEELNLKYIEMENENGKQYFVVKMTDAEFNKWKSIAYDLGNNGENEENDVFTFMLKKAYDGYIGKNIVNRISQLMGKHTACDFMTNRSIKNCDD